MHNKVHFIMFMASSCADGYRRQDGGEGWSHCGCIGNAEFPCPTTHSTNCTKLSHASTSKLGGLRLELWDMITALPLCPLENPFRLSGSPADWKIGRLAMISWIVTNF